jgi:hypothetical protein
MISVQSLAARIDRLPRIVRAPLFGGTLAVLLSVFALLSGDRRAPLTLVPVSLSAFLLRAMSIGAITGLAAGFVTLPLARRHDGWRWIGFALTMTLYFLLMGSLIKARHEERVLDLSARGRWIFEGVLGFVVGLGIAAMASRADRLSGKDRARAA